MLLDIDLDFLNFIVNPSYEYIREKIPYIMEGYISEFGEEYREHITDNFSRVNYIFLLETSELSCFIKNYQSEIIFEAYQRLAGAFGIHLKKYYSLDASHSFIERELLEAGMYEVCDDKTLEVFRNQLRNYLVKVRDDSTCDERNFLDTQIQYIDETIEKFDHIMAIFTPKIELINEIDKKKQKARAILQRKFIKNHSYWLKEETRQFIENHEDYDVYHFLKGCPEVQKYIRILLKNSVFDLRKLSAFENRYNDNDYFLEERRKILIENGIDVSNINIRNDDLCLRKLNIIYKQDGITYYGRVALKKLEEELEYYNSLLEAEYEKYKYLIPEEDFISKYVISDSIINRDCNQDFKDALMSMEGLSRENFYRDFGKLFFKVSNSSHDAICFSQSITFSNELESKDVDIRYIVIKIFKNMRIEDGVILNSIFYTLSHELGHGSVIDTKGISGLNSGEKYTMLNELINEYVSGKVMNKLLSLYSIFDIEGTKSENLSLYHINSFLIHPFMEEFELYFKEAIIENDITVLSDLMGEYLLDSYIETIHSFFAYHESRYFNAVTIFEQEPEYIEQIKKQIQETIDHIKQRRKGYIYQKKK